MAANVRIITPNESDDAVLSASPALVSTLPVANLQDQTRKVARTSSLATQHIYGNFNATKQISAFALVRHNLTAAGTYRLKLYDGLNQTGTLVYDSGSIALGSPKGWGEFVWGVDPWGADSFSGWPSAYVVQYFTQVTALSLDLQLDDPANTSGYMEAARLFIGSYFEPSKNMAWGLNMSWQENSTQERTDGGTLRTDARQPYRRWAFSLELLTQGERAQLANIFRKVGLRNDMFLSCFPAQGGQKEIDYAGAVKLKQMPEQPTDFINNWRNDLIFEEA